MIIRGNALKVNIVREISLFLNDNSIKYYVLHGIEPYSGKIGRDIDICMPNEKDRLRLIYFCYLLFKRRDARWAIVMNPIWGNRCIGIWDKDFLYMEIHLIAKLTLWHVNAIHVINDDNGIQGSFDLIFSPGLFFFKNILNKNFWSILKGRKLWLCKPPEKYAVVHSEAYKKMLKSWVPKSHKFVNALLGDDTDINIKSRRNGLITLLSYYIYRHPFSSATNIVRALYKHIAFFWNPCSPFVYILTNSSFEKLQEGITNRLQGIFPKIVVSKTMPTWRIRRQMTSHQQLYVVIGNSQKAIDLGLFDTIIDDRSFDETNDKLGLICKSIIDSMSAMNDRWRFQGRGLWVAFMGTDGSGKSSVINSILPTLASNFRQVHYIHLRFKLRSKISNSDTPVTDPHAQKARNLFASIAKILYFFCNYNFGYWLKIRPMLACSTLVVFDRYYHDLLVDPKRYRYGGPMWFARFIGKWIPQPDLFILLDAPTEVLQSRKKEVPFEETERQREAYLALIRKMKNGVIVNAAQPLEKVVADTNKIVIDFMNNRTKKFG